jgi:hypothetical protein
VFFLFDEALFELSVNFFLLPVDKQFRADDEEASAEEPHNGIHEEYKVEIDID